MRGDDVVLISANVEGHVQLKKNQLYSSLEHYQLCVYYSQVLCVNKGFCVFNDR